MPRYRGQRGYIVGETRNRRHWHVRLPGRKHPVTFQKCFIVEVVESFLDGMMLVMPAIHQETRHPLRHQAPSNSL